MELKPRSVRLQSLWSSSLHQTALQKSPSDNESRAQGALRRFQHTETHTRAHACTHTCANTHTHAPSLVADPAKNSLGKGPETIQAQDPPSPGRGLSASEVPSMGRGVRVPLVCAPVGAEVSPAL